eukprot:SAG31_NODE_29615_length_392_cov_1.058020_1_plen_111_part_10
MRDADFGGASDHIGYIEMPCTSIFTSPTGAVSGWFHLQDREKWQAKKKSQVLASSGSGGRKRVSSDVAADAMSSGEIYLHFEFETAGSSFRGTLADDGGVAGPVRTGSRKG